MRRIDISPGEVLPFPNERVLFSYIGTYTVTSQDYQGSIILYYMYTMILYNDPGETNLYHSDLEYTDIKLIGRPLVETPPYVQYASQSCTVCASGY